MAKKKRLAHICLMVHDIDRAIEDYRKILGVVQPDQLVQPMVFYEDFGVGAERLKFATFPADGCEIQLMQPLTPGTPLYERLQRFGEGVHHICFTSTNVREIAKQLIQQGIRLAHQGDVVTDPQMPWQKWTFVHHMDAHGVLIELAQSYQAVNGKWERDPDIED